MLSDKSITSPTLNPNGLSGISSKSSVINSPILTSANSAPEAKTSSPLVRPSPAVDFISK